MNVLFFAYSFPPANYPATQRTWNMARTLAESGSRVDVVTLRPEAWLRTNEEEAKVHPRIRRIEVPARRAFLLPWELRGSRYPGARLCGGIARQLARRFRVDPYSGWFAEASTAAGGYTDQQVALVLATGSPFNSFELARRAAARLRRPYVIDYRDLWHQNPHAAGAWESSGGEAAIVRDAAAVLTVSPSMLRVLDRAYGIERKGHVLPNAFDAEEMAAVTPHVFDHFAVVYTGQFYPPKRTPEPILMALRESGIPGWKFHYAGPHGQQVARSAALLGVADRAILHGNVSRKESLSLTAGASLAVVVTSVQRRADDADLGIITSKVFDVLGLQRPLLVIAPPGSDVETVIGGRAGTASFCAHETSAMARWMENLSRIPVEAQPASAHSWQRRGEELLKILNEVVRS